MLAAAAAPAGLQPNQITALSACCTFVGLGLVALVSPRWWLGFVVSALLLLGYALDSADGQLARLRGGGTRAGEWLDHVVDATKISVLHIVVLISFYRFTDASDLQLLAALGYQVVASVLFFGMILIDQLRRRTYGCGPAPARTRNELLQTAVALPTDYGLLCLSFVLLGWPAQFKVVYIVLFFLNAVILIGTLLKWWRDVRMMDQRGA